MNDTERYLRAATRGMWGRERRALREELAGHIRVRVSELMVAGHPEAEAERLTLRELGAASEVSTGMVKVYALNTAIKGAVISSLLAFVGLLTVQQAQAQVRGVYGTVGNNMTAAYINIEQLKKELQKAGGDLSMTPSDGYVGTLRVPGVPRPVYPVQAWPGAVLKQGGQEYLNVIPFLNTLQNMGTSVQITGWKNPQMTVGKMTIGIQTDDWRIINQLYYSTLIGSSPSLTDYGRMPWHFLDPNGTTEQVTIRNAQFKAGHIYALVLPLPGEWWMQDSNGKRTDSGMLNLAVNVAQADTDGKAIFRVYPLTQTFKLVSTEEKFLKMARPHEDKYVIWNDEQPAPGLLLELTGRMSEDAYRILPISGWK